MPKKNRINTPRTDPVAVIKKMYKGETFNMKPRGIAFHIPVIATRNTVNISKEKLTTQNILLKKTHRIKCYCKNSRFLIKPLYFVLFKAEFLNIRLKSISFKFFQSESVILSHSRAGLNSRTLCGFAFLFHGQTS